MQLLFLLCFYQWTQSSISDNFRNQRQSSRPNAHFLIDFFFLLFALCPCTYWYYSLPRAPPLFFLFFFFPPSSSCLLAHPLFLPWLSGDSSQNWLRFTVPKLLIFAFYIFIHWPVSWTSLMHWSSNSVMTFNVLYTKTKYGFRIEWKNHHLVVCDSNSCIFWSIYYRTCLQLHFYTTSILWPN